VSNDSTFVRRSRAVIGGALALLLAGASSTSAVLMPPTNNLVLWLNAEALPLADGTPVSYWSDSSLADHDAVLLAGWNAPIYAAHGVNGRPGVFFGPAASLRITNNVSGGRVLLPGGLTFAAGFKTFSSASVPPNAGTTANTLLEDNTGNDTIAFGVNGGYGDFQRYQNTPPAGWYAPPSSDAVNNTNLFQGHFLLATHNSSSGFVQLFADGQLQGTNTTGYNGLTGFNIVGDLNGARYFNGWIGEMLVYNAELSAADQALLTAYLSRRWLEIPEPSVTALLALSSLLLWNRRRTR
jgi:hypothetical protein